DSALARRLENQAKPLITTGGRVRKRLNVTLPTPTDEFEALGFTTRPAPGYGERAWLLRQLVSHVRPERWTEWLRLDASGLVDQAAKSEEARPILEGWIAATSHFGDASWAAAILGNPAI